MLRGSRGAERNGHQPGEEARKRPQRAAWPTFRRAMGLLGQHKRTLAAYLSAIAAVSLVGLAPPLLIRAIIDEAIPRGDGGQLNQLVLLMLVFILGGALLGVVQSFLSNIIAQGVMLDLRRGLYAHISRMSMRWFTSNRSGDVLSRVSNDVGSIQSVMSDTFGSLVGNVITLTSTLALMLVLDWRLALFSLAFLPLFLIPARRVGNFQRALQRETQERMANLNSHMQETLSVDGALLVKTFGRRDAEESRFNETARQVMRLSVRRAMVGRWFWMALGLFGSVGPGVVYWYGGHRIIGGDASLGTVVALAALLPRLFGPMSSLLNLNVNVLSSLALFERIFEYLDLRPEISDKPDARELVQPRGHIEFRSVSFAYADDQALLEDISFEIKPGQFIALVGATGAGKTTLVGLLLRLYEVSGGRVLIDGSDIRDLKLDSLSSSIALVEQEPFLFHTSIRQNLLYAREDATDSEIEAAARAANIHDFIEGLPDGYNTVAGEKGYRLSGGEKQRVAIARALLKDPAILVLDEATSNVDTMTEAAIQQAIDNVRKGRTVVAIAHRLSTIQAADAIFVLEKGRLIESGTHEELLAVGGHYQRLYARQLHTQRDTPAPA